MEFTTGNKGARNLIHNGYRYYNKRENKSGEVVWWCVKEKSCRGKVVVKEDQVLREEEHQCVPDVAKLEVTKAIANAKKRAREDDNATIAQVCKQYIKYNLYCIIYFGETDISIGFKGSR